MPSAPLAAELLLMHALGRDRTWLYTHPEAPLDPHAAEKYFALVARRAAGEPAQYLTGKQEFWGLEFEVTPAVLIPRPETEHVIEVALERLGARGIKIDMNTGAPSPAAHRRRRHRLGLPRRCARARIAARRNLRHGYFRGGARSCAPQRRAARCRRRIEIPRKPICSKASSRRH